MLYWSVHVRVGSSHPGCDGNEEVNFPSSFLFAPLRPKLDSANKFTYTIVVVVIVVVLVVLLPSSFFLPFLRFV